MNRVLVLYSLLSVTSPAGAADALLLPVQSVSTEPDPADRSKYQVHVKLTEEGRSKFGAFTAEHVGQRIVVMANGSVVSPPIRILTQITAGEVILNSVSQTEAEQTVRLISNSPAGLSLELSP